MVILAGGGARRLGGRDKPGLIVDGRSLLEAVIGAGVAADRIIVVGPWRTGMSKILFVREEPPGSGPVPALRRGLAEVTAPWVAVLAADLPFLREQHIRALLDAAARTAAGTGGVLADDTGRPQWLAGCWRTAVLRTALAGYEGDSLRGLLAPLEPALIRFDPAPEEPPPWLDCDTPTDVERARRLAGEQIAGPRFTVAGNDRNMGIN